MNNQKELTLTRIFDAPRILVFKAWSDPREIQKWWGPKGVTNPTCVWEFKPGGKIHIVMLAGEELGEMAGDEWPMIGEFKEIQEPEKIVFTSSAIMNDKPILENLCTVTFEEEDGKTRMNVHVLVTKTTPEAEGPLWGMEMGWREQLDKLGESLDDQ